MNRTLKWIGAGLVLALAVGLFAWGASSEAEAQSQQVWYRIVNEGRSAGTMARWQPLSRTVSATFPFVDDFQVTLQPQNGLVHALISDGQSRVSASVSCDGSAPNGAMLRATRADANQPAHSPAAGQRQSTILVALRCASSEPPVR